MKIQRSKETGYIYAEFKTPEGTRRVSLKTKSFDEAKSMAREQKFAQIEHAAKAKALTSEVIMRLTSGRRVTVDMGIDEYIESLRINRMKELTIASMGYKLKAWARDRRLGMKMVTEIDRKHIDAQINTSEPIALSTRRTTLGYIKDFMAFCVARGWRMDNPAMECRIVVDDIPHALQVPQERKVFTPEEVKKLLEATAGDQFWHTAIQLAFYHGLRISDCATLEWDSYNKFKGKMVITMSKTDKPISFNLDAAVKRIMDAMPKSDSRYVWPSQAATWIDVNSTSNLSQQFRRICIRNGIDGKSFHGLRHSFAMRRQQEIEAAKKEQWMRELIKEQATRQVADELGHKSTKTTQIYLKH